MGPEGGSGGGKVVAEGTPEQVLGAAGSHTGEFLGHVLDAAPRPVPTSRRAAAKRAVAARTPRANARARA